MITNLLIISRIFHGPLGLNLVETVFIFIANIALFNNYYLKRSIT